MGEGEGGIRGKQIPAFHKDAVNAEMPPVTLHAPEIRAKILQADKYTKRPGKSKSGPFTRSN